MKNKVLFVLLTLTLIISAVFPAFAGQTNETSTSAEAGEVVEVNCFLADITGFNGTITCKDWSIVESIYVDGGDKDSWLIFNPDTGAILYYGAEAVNFELTITVELKEDAQPGEETTIEFVFELPDEKGLLPTEPDYYTLNAKIYILDYSFLRYEIDRASDLNEDEYTEDSWAAMEEELVLAIQLDGNADTQEEIDAATAALKAAIDALVKKTPVELDYSELQAQVDRVADLNELEYTKGSWDAMIEALNAANALLPDNAETQDQIDDAAAALKAAIDALVKLDYTELDKQIADAESKVEKEYTEGSWAVMVAALGSARSARTDARTQEEIDAAAAELKDAIAALVKLDYSELEAQIARVDTLESEDYYTAASWATMIEALENAREVLGTARTQEAIDEAAAALKAAIDALEEKPGPVQLDYSELDRLILEAKSKDKSKYTAETYKAMEEALELAINTRNNATTQEEIDNAAQSLKAAIDDLKPVGGATGDSSMTAIILVVALGLGLAYIAFSKRKVTAR